MSYYPMDSLEFNVSRGLVQNTSVRNIFGYQEAISTTFIPAWEFATPYVFPSVPLIMTVDSGSATDDGKLCRIIGLDNEYNTIQEDVALNSTTPPNTVNEFLRINDCIMITGGSNDSLITISNGGQNYAGIRPNDGRNQASVYTVPAGYDFFLYRIDAFSADSTSAKPGIFRNCTANGSGQKYIVARTTFYNNMNIQRRLPFKYQEKTDIALELSTFSGTHEMNVFAEGILIKKPITQI